MAMFDAARLAAAFEAAEGALWLVDKHGRITDPDGRRFVVPTLAALPEPAARIFTTALQNRAPARAEVALGPEDAPRHLQLRFAPATAGAAAGILHAADLSRERTLEAQLGQAQRLQAVGELASGIAHDFNNLLTAIIGAADDLAARSTVAADRADLEQIHAGAERGAALVRQLLAFGRQQTLQPRTIGLNDAVGAAAALIGRLIGAHIDLKLELEHPGRAVRVDPMQLDQILVNLAVNAAHAMKQGGALTIATGHRTVLRPQPLGAETLPPGRYATLAVRDTGAGIPRHVLPRIFEPFFTTRRAHGGAGLGLSTVHGIVRQSDGYIEVESEVGQGTCFTILLPRHEPETAALPAPPPAVPPAPAPPPRPDAAPRRLLLVEDETPIRGLAERALARAGFEVMARDCAQAALEAVAGTEERLDGVVSDVVMPGMDGPALIAALRRRRPALPAVLMSGYVEASARPSVAQPDVVFIAKPFSMRELVAIVEQACGAADHSRPGGASR